jgi:ADP-heptose:LPS heptosyltransferase
MIGMRSRTKRAAAMAADSVLSLVAPLLHSGSIPVRPRVLLIRADHIGDAAMATAVLQPLRDALRPSVLDVLAGPWAAPIFEDHSAVDRVIEYATPWWSAARGAPMGARLALWAALPNVIRRIRDARYDVGIDLRGDLRQIAFFLAATGIPVRVSTDRTGGRRMLTHVWPFDDARHEVEKNGAIAALVGATGDLRLDIAVATDPPSHVDVAGDYVVFAIAGTDPRRSWPAPHVAALAKALHRELGLSAVFIGAPKDVDAGAAIARLARSPFTNLAGHTSLRDLLAVLQRAALTVAVDSGPMHLMAAVGSPLIALFGVSDPAISGPWSDEARVLTGTSMEAIRPETVLAAARTLVTTSPRVVQRSVR